MCNTSSSFPIIPFSPAKQMWRGFRDCEIGRHFKPNDCLALTVSRAQEQGPKLFGKPYGFERSLCNRDILFTEIPGRHAVTCAMFIFVKQLS